MTGKARMTALLLALVFALAPVTALANVGDRIDDTTNSGLWFVVTAEDLVASTGTVAVTTPTGVYSSDTYAVPATVSSATIIYNVTAIGTNTFANCASLTSVSIPPSVTAIGERAFQRTGLTTVTIPGSVATISLGAFHLSSLTNVTIGNGVQTIGNSAFSQTGLTTVNIPDSVTSIGNSAFGSCASLTGVTIGNGVKTIGVQAFASCTSLTSVIIPDSVMSIGMETFSNCVGLTSVIIGSDVQTIGQDAFRDCTNLTSVTIPASVTSIGAGTFQSTGLQTVTFLGNTPPATITSTAFRDVTGPVNVYVPYGRVQDYIDAFTNANLMTPPSPTFNFFEIAAPAAPSSGSGWYPPDPVSQPKPPPEAKAAFPAQGTVTAKRINAYAKDTLKGKVAFRMNKGEAFTILGLSKKAFRIQYDDKEGYIAIKDIQATFGAALRGTALKKAGAYVLWEENGKLTREGYFAKGQKLPIHGIEGGYLVYNSAAGTYYLKTSEWQITE